MAGGSVFDPKVVKFGWASLIFVILIFFTIALELCFHHIEHALKQHKFYYSMLQKVYKELMILGLISFSLVLMKEVAPSLVSNHSNLVQFEFAHLWLFFMALLFLGQALILALQMKGIKTQWEQAASQSTEVVIEKARLLPLSKFAKFMYDLGFNSFDINSLQIDFHLARRSFMKFQMVPMNLPYDKYLRRSVSLYIERATEIEESTWLFIIVILGVQNLLHLAIDSSYNKPKYHEANAMYWFTLMLPGYLLMFVEIGVLVLMKKSHGRLISHLADGATTKEHKVDALSRMLVEEGKQRLACIKIQARARGMITRKQYKELLDKRSKALGAELDTTEQEDIKAAGVLDARQAQRFSNDENATALGVLVEQLEEHYVFWQHPTGKGEDLTPFMDDVHTPEYDRDPTFLGKKAVEIFPVKPSLILHAFEIGSLVNCLFLAQLFISGWIWVSWPKDVLLAIGFALVSIFPYVVYQIIHAETMESFLFAYSYAFVRPDVFRSLITYIKEVEELRLKVSEKMKDVIIKSAQRQLGGNPKYKGMDWEQLRVGPGEFTLLFNEADSSGDGSLSFEELKEAISKCGLPIGHKKMHRFQTMIDIDKNGIVTLDEWIDLMASGVEAEDLKKLPKLNRTLRDAIKAGDFRFLEQDISIQMHSIH